jgi:hypothetical protein
MKTKQHGNSKDAVRFKRGVLCENLTLTSKKDIVLAFSSKIPNGGYGGVRVGDTYKSGHARPSRLYSLNRLNLLNGT